MKSIASKNSFKQAKNYILISKISLEFTSDLKSIPKKSVCIQWIPLPVVLITITFRRVISF